MKIETRYNLNDRVHCIKHTPENTAFTGVIIGINYLLSTTNTKEVKHQITYLVKEKTSCYRVTESEITYSF